MGHFDDQNVTYSTCALPESPSRGDGMPSLMSGVPCASIPLGCWLWMQLRSHAHKHPIHAMVGTCVLSRNAAYMSEFAFWCALRLEPQSRWAVGYGCNSAAVHINILFMPW